MKRPRQLISSREAVKAKCQHTAPCSDCPWDRNSLRGWLGSQSPRDWIHIAHDEAIVECHAQTSVQCAGIAIFRANVAKSLRTPLALKLPPDRERVFATNDEFIKHHDIFKR